MSFQDQTLANLRHRLRSLGTDFSARVVVLLGDLAYQPDVDLRLLGVLLSFNEFYPVVNKRRTRERGDAATRRGTPRTTAKPKAKSKENSDASSLAAPTMVVDESH
jgi:gamma-tubulin complex component 3